MFGGANIEFFLHMQDYFPGFLKFALMNSCADKSLFKLLVNWYSQNKRPLPWRETANPYHIYISEIVFQQTRIDQGISYYNSIIDKYPDFISLSKAGEKDFLNIWQGLGYYSRAHNILKAAAIIAEKYSGKLPNDYNKLLELPGIGPYTAAAIASIAFGLPCPVVDGNVKRVISRLRCIGIPLDKTGLTNEIQEDLNQQIHHFNPSDFNQALMELGALVCTPANPDCSGCPVNKYCCAFKTGTTEKYPVKAVTKTKPSVFINYYVVFSNDKKDSLYMVQRENEKIWKGLYEFPCRESAESEASVNTVEPIFPTDFPFEQSKLVYSANHVLTHRMIHASFYETVFKNKVPPHWIKIPVSRVSSMPVHRLIQLYLEHSQKSKNK